MKKLSLFVTLILYFKIIISVYKDIRNNKDLSNINNIGYFGNKWKFGGTRDEEYNKCLQIRKNEILYPTVLMVLEGRSVTLNCDICLYPLEMDLEDIVEWYFNSSSNNNLVNLPVLSSDHTIIYPNGTLKMYNIELKQAGRYWCKVNNTIAALYFLHIDNGSEPISIVNFNKVSKAPHSKSPTILSKYYLKIYSEWTSWSPCSACDIVGKKVRYGYCTILLLKNNPTKNNITTESTIDEYYAKNQIYKRKVQEDKNVGEMKKLQNVGHESKYKINNELEYAIKNVLPKFRNKLPCRSSYTPYILQNMPSVKERKTEIMVRFCKIKCEKNVIFEIRNKYGKVLESANNSAGIYSMLQKLPQILPVATRTTLYREHNIPCELKCLGNLNSDVPISWKIGTKIINEYLIKEQSSGRIQINQYRHIIFKQLRFSDTNIYSCWQNNKLAGIIKLVVTYEVKLKLNHHILMIGGIAIISVFLLVFWKAFKGRNRFTKH